MIQAKQSNSIATIPIDRRNNLHIFDIIPILDPTLVSRVISFSIAQFRVFPPESVALTIEFHHLDFAIQYRHSSISHLGH